MIGMKRRYEIEITNGTIIDKIFIFAIPMIISGLLQLLFNAADVVVVGRYVGTEALAAVGSNVHIINLFIFLFNNMASGVNVISARYIGERNADGVRKCVDTAIITALVSGVVASLIGIFSIHHVLVWMKSPAGVIELTTLYLRIYFCGFPALILYNFGDALLRSKGDTKHPLYYLTGAGLLNVVLNLIFVLVFNMGVAGVGLATIISQYISAILVLRLLIKDEGMMHLNLRRMKFDMGVFKKVAYIGVPASLQSLCFTISNLFIGTSVNSFGMASIVAGASTGQSIDCFMEVAVNNIGVTCMTFVSQNYGARRHDRIKRTVRYCSAFSLLSAFIGGAIIVIFAKQLAGLYAPGQDEVIEYASQRMYVEGGTYITYSVLNLFLNALRGLGYSIGPTIILIIGTCFTRIAWIYTGFRIIGTYQSIFYLYPISWALTGLALMILYFSVRKKIRGNSELTDMLNI